MAPTTSVTPLPAKVAALTMLLQSVSQRSDTVKGFIVLTAMLQWFRASPRLPRMLHGCVPIDESRLMSDSGSILPIYQIE